MEKIPFKNKYVSNLPLVDSLCPECNVGVIKTGKWDSMLCFDCHTAFKKDKYVPPEKAGTPQSEPKDLIMIETMTNIGKVLKAIYELLNERLPKL